MKVKESLKKVVSNISKMGDTVVYSGEIEKLHDRKDSSARRILIISNIRIFFYSIASNPSLKRSFFWCGLSSLLELNKSDDNPEFGLTFQRDDQMRFKALDSNSSLIIQMILGDLFQRIFTKQEQERLQLSEAGIFRKAFSAYQNSFGMYSRFLSYLKSSKQSINETEQLKFFQFSAYRRKHANLSDRSSAKLWDCHLYGINGLTFLESLQFSCKSIDIYEKLNTFYTQEHDDFESSTWKHPISSNIHHFQFDGVKHTKNFDKFLTNLSNGEIQHQLSSLSFSNINFKEDDFKKIGSFCQSVMGRSPIKSLSFNDVLQEKDNNYFIKDFLSSYVTQNLVCFSLQDSLDIDMTIFLYKIRNISVLSLANSQIAIQNILHIIQQTEMKNLRMLDLSENLCYSVDNQPCEFIFPSTLNVLYVRKVNWGNLNLLPSFFSSFSQFQPMGELHLSIRSISGNENQINDALRDTFNNIETSNITHLDWATNPISIEFIDFLKKCPGLIEIDVSNCFSGEMEDHQISKKTTQHDVSLSLFGRFCEYISQHAKKLENLIIAGNSNFIVDDPTKKRKKSNESNENSRNLSGTSLFPLFNAIKETKSKIQYLNIRNQNIQMPDGLHLLGDVIFEVKSIEKLSISNTGFTSLELFSRFIKKFQKRGKPLMIEWPREEIDKFKNEKEISKQQLAHYKKLLIRLSKCNFYYVPDDQKVSDDDDDDYSDSSEGEVIADYNYVYDRKSSSSNPMAKRIETFSFDIEKTFPIYFSESVEEFLNKMKACNSPRKTESASSNHTESRNKHTQNEPKKRELSDDEPEVKRTPIQRRKISIHDSDDDQYSPRKRIPNDDSDEEINEARRGYKPRNRNQRNDDDDDDYLYRKRRNTDKYFVSADNRNNRNRNRRSERRYSADDIENNSPKRNSNKDDKWAFPNEIVNPRFNERQMMRDVEANFTFDNLMDLIVNHCK